MTPKKLTPTQGQGNAHSIAANRLSYFLRLARTQHGSGYGLFIIFGGGASGVSKPSERRIRSGRGRRRELNPHSRIDHHLLQARMLSPDGRCKTFDASADGYVRGEGCGVIVLKRMSDAIRDGDNILALIRGSAVNQDGRSNGFTAPNGLAQQDVIRQALANAQVAPHQIGYVEAHGTGTPLGDPIEMASLHAVLDDGQTNGRVLVGSVKTNIGHLESAAGIAGLIKSVLAMQHEAIPPHLHLKEVNPYLSLENSRLEIGTYLASVEATRAAALCGCEFLWLWRHERAYHSFRCANACFINAVRNYGTSAPHFCFICKDGFCACLNWLNRQAFKSSQYAIACK
jgi:hypothetical protein